MMKRRRFLCLSAAFACAPRFAAAATWRGQALGAEVGITLGGPRDETGPALAAIPALLEEIESLFSLYRADSALVRLNRAGQLAAPPAFLRLAEAVTGAHDLTGGLFDPTVQGLWQALSRGEDPRAARAAIGWHRVVLKGSELRLAPGQALTFNGIAQGFATDLVRDLLRDRGFVRALVNIGEHAALGGPFRLGLADPAQGLIGQRTLTDGAIATSSPLADRLHGLAHIQSPDGRPPLWSTVSIESPSAAWADALSTAAVFMERWALAALKRDAALTRITLVTPEGDVTTL